ncbi:MAG: preprotein translocase subunit SecG [Pseudomonadota bacterium]|nr:preprotein translocase subunit SecG [Pseudomonadota bacterium]
METLVLVVHILVALIMIALILVQQGKGAEAGATFGGGGAATVFGAAGSGNFLTRTTAIMTTIFFMTSLGLAVIAKREAADLLTLPAVQAPVTQPTSPRPLTENISATPTVGQAATAEESTDDSLEIPSMATVTEAPVEPTENSTSISQTDSVE